MGLFDTITVWPSGQVHCAAGHRLDELQTKSLECEMGHYALFEGALYRHGREAEQAVVSERGRPVLRTIRPLESEKRTVTVVAYTHCEVCRPILYLAARAAWGDEVHERLPWVEWRIEIVDGRLVDLTPLRTETREDIRAALRAEGLEVLDDDERLARLHFARRNRHPEA